MSLTSRMHRKMHEHVPDELDGIGFEQVAREVRAIEARMTEGRRVTLYPTRRDRIRYVADDIRHARMVAIESGRF